MSNEKCSMCESDAEYSFMHSGPKFCEKHYKIASALLGDTA